MPSGSRTFSLAASLGSTSTWRSRSFYFMQHGSETDVLTNLENGRSLRSVNLVIEKDLRVTDNGDGTVPLVFAK
jgi:hypothetical protein